MTDFVKEAMDMRDELTGWRRELHRIPETGTTLPRTVAFVAARLEEMGIEHRVFEDISCVTAHIGSGKPCFLLRADMDGVEVREETELPFRSENGCMHGCGHDMHATMLLGAARLLKNHESQLKGSVKLLFQSGEEVFRGAKAAIGAGVLESPKVEGAFAAHVVAALPLGVALTGEKATSSVYGFEISVTGRGGHGSMPEQAIDPINAGVQVYLALQSLIAREVGGTQEAVLTIGSFRAGDGANVIPEKAVLRGTLRCFDPELRRRLISRIEEMSLAVAAAYRCGAELTTLSDCPGLVTDRELSAHVEAQIRQMLPDMQVYSQAVHGMGSEDFAFIAEQVPSSYFMLGAGVPDRSLWLGQHNPRVLFNEDILPVGAAIYARAAASWLEARAAK